MTTVHGYYLTVVIFHVSLLIGLLSYVLKDVDQNGLIGLRTPGTLANEEIWNRANAQVGRVMPVLSGVCAFVGLGGIWFGVLRTGVAFLLIIGFQIAVLIGFTIAWWSPSKISLSLLQESNHLEEQRKQK